MKILQFQDRICFLLLKTVKYNGFSGSDWWRNTKSSIKGNARTFIKNSTTQDYMKILRLKENCKTYTEKKTSNMKLNQ